MRLFGFDVKYGIIESTLTGQPANAILDLLLPLNCLHKLSQVTWFLGFSSLENGSVD